MASGSFSLYFLGLVSFHVPMSRTRVLRVVASCMSGDETRCVCVRHCDNETEFAAERYLPTELPAMFNLQPISIHLPIALLLIVPAIELCGLIVRIDSYHTVALYALSSAVPMATIAVVTGLVDSYGMALVGPPNELLQFHLLLGVILVLLAGGILVGRFTYRQQQSSDCCWWYIHR